MKLQLVFVSRNGYWFALHWKEHLLLHLLVVDDADVVVGDDVEHSTPIHVVVDHDEDDSAVVTVVENDDVASASLPRPYRSVPESGCPLLENVNPFLRDRLH